MKRTRFTEEQIVGVLHEAGGEVSIREVCHEYSDYTPTALLA
jgi:hypothetical protein